MRSKIVVLVLTVVAILAAMPAQARDRARARDYNRRYDSNQGSQQDPFIGLNRWKGQMEAYNDGLFTNSRSSNYRYSSYNRDRRYERRDNHGLLTNLASGSAGLALGYWLSHRTAQRQQTEEMTPETMAPQIYQVQPALPVPPSPTSMQITFVNCTPKKVYVGDPRIDGGVYLEPGARVTAPITTQVWGNFTGTPVQAPIVLKDGMAQISVPKGD